MTYKEILIEEDYNILASYKDYNLTKERLAKLKTHIKDSNNNVIVFELDNKIIEYNKYIKKIKEI